MQQTGPYWLLARLSRVIWETVQVLENCLILVQWFSQEKDTYQRCKSHVQMKCPSHQAQGLWWSVTQSPYPIIKRGYQCQNCTSSTIDLFVSEWMVMSRRNSQYWNGTLSTVKLEWYPINSKINVLSSSFSILQCFSTLVRQYTKILIQYRFILSQGYWKNYHVHLSA